MQDNELKQIAELEANLQNTTLALVQERQAALARAEKEKLLNRWIERINSSFDLDELLILATQDIGQYLKVDRCGIVLFGRSGVTIQEYTHRNFEREVSIEVVRNSRFLRKARRLRKTYQQNTIKEEHKAEFTQDVKSFLSVPLTVDGEVAGILYLQQCNKARVWNSRELDLLNATVAPLATAIEKARLYRIAKEQRDHAELLNRLTVQIRSSLNFEDILSRTVKELGVALGVSRCFLFFDGFVSEEYTKVGVSSIHGFAEHLIVDSMVDTESFGTIAIGDIYGDVNFSKLSDVEQQELKQSGAKAILATPLHFQNILQAWIVLHSTEERSWTPEEIGFVEAIASQVIVAMTQSKMYEKLDSYQEKLSRELKQAARVQTSLIGGDVFDAHLDMSVFYKAHSNVSGDFYSVAELAPHVVGVLIGDVSGKGPAAALLTGYLLGEFNSVVSNSSLAWYPDKLINFLCRSILYQNESSDFYATAWYGVIDLQREKLCYANAGHLNPYLINQDRKVGPLDSDDDIGVPLGLIDPRDIDESYECREVDFKVGEKLVLFTDGLMDQKMPGGEFVPKDWAEKALEEVKHKQVKDISYELNERLNELSAATPLTDDRLIICLEQKKFNLEVFDLADASKCQALIAEIVDKCVNFNMPSEKVINLKLGLTEALTNAVRYGLDKNPYGQIKLGYTVDQGTFKMSIIDPGPGFNWQVHKHTFIDEVEFEEEGGRGIPLLNEIFDKVSWNPRGNMVGLFFYW